MSHVDEGMLHAYLDGECGERERQEIESHIAECESCRERLAQASALSREAADLLAELEPSPVQAPPWREIESRSAARARASSRRSWVRPSLAWAASIALAFGLGWFSNSFQAGLSPAIFADRQAAYRANEAEADQPRLEDLDLPAGAGEAAADAFRPARKTETAAAPAESQLRDQALEARGKATLEVGAARKESGRRELAEGLAATGRDERVAEAERPAATQPLAEEAQPAAEPPARPAQETATRAAELKARADDQAAARAPAAFAERQRAGRQLENVRVSLDRASDTEITGRFFAVQPEEAALWLGGELRVLPDLDLRRVEVGPGARVEGGVPGLPAVRLAYEDAAGNEILLVQQRASELQKKLPDDPALVIDPSGLNSYRWSQGGYRLILQARVSGDSLRALADRIR